MARITMALEWFTKILKDYSNWLFAWAREAGQNSLDAGATAITVSVALNEEGNTVVSWHDNGKGMTRDILTTKFMAVGGSAKEAGNAGGFGVAKLVLAFAQICYTIRTGFLFVTGRNEEYEIIETRDNHNGLTLTATMAGDNVVRFTEACEEWVKHTTPSRPVLFYLNGTALRFMGKLPEAASVQDWCTLHVCEDMAPGIKVRINGQFMFSVWSDVSACVFVELTGSSLEYLTSNRDSLQWHYKDKLTKLATAMTRDPEVLFDTDSDVIELYKGELGAVNEIRETVSISLAPSPAGRPHWNATEEDCEEMSEERRGNACQPIDSLRTTKRPDETRAPSRLMLKGNDFVILNKTNKAIPTKYTVDGMRPMEWRLLGKWTRIVEACAGILGFGRLTIRTGWIFSVTAQAAYKRSTEHGSLVLLNPCKLEGKNWVKGFDTSKDSFYTLVALAVHELTHIRHGYHDEFYAGALTDNMAKVFANMATVNKAK